MQTACPLASPGTGQMTADDESGICALCKRGRVSKRMEQVEFRQMSNKGYVYCRVTVLIGTCDHCRARTTDDNAEELFDEAFKREYDKLP